jgi:protein-S-isoprenylcysteine O-methyltransferase Ste14
VVLTIKLVIFAIVSGGIIFVSWTSFRNPRSHGFYRFFAFESTLVLILLNLDNWFRDPFSIHQIVSWLLLFVSIVLVAHGIYLLRVVGRPKSGIESTTTLVMVGAYKYIRHPLYGSLLFLAWGVFFKDVSLLGGILASVATAFLIVIAKMEEAENIQKFGAEYAAYMKTTRMFIPFLF